MHICLSQAANGERNGFICNTAENERNGTDNWMKVLNYSFLSAAETQTSILSGVRIFCVNMNLTI